MGEITLQPSSWGSEGDNWRCESRILVASFLADLNKNMVGVGRLDISINYRSSGR